MQSYQISSHPLVLSVIHSSFQHAVEELGLPFFPQETFLGEISACIAEPYSIFEDTPESRERIWGAVKRGEVIAAEMKDNLAVVFHVRAIDRRRCIDVRLVFEHQTWRIDKVVSMYAQKLRHTRFLQGSVVSAAVLVAGILGYMLHGTQSIASTPVTSRVLAQNPNPVKQARVEASQTVKVSNSPLIRQGSTAVSGNPSSAKKPTMMNISFHLKSGMPLNDLSKFLQSHHLISSVVSFDLLMHSTKVDRSVRPGIYHFKTNMTQQQLIQVLRHAPSS